MRLLYFDNGEVKLTPERSSHGHQYAILSHTWGHDDEEVTFQDLQKGRGKGKQGYRKILFCGEQARRDGFEYWWVDSCCIDKSSQSELAEAIMSMFRWYQNAARCYVYLSDVAMSNAKQIDMDNPTSALHGQFRKTKWFTRGWTLQELLAPRQVLFYSSDEGYLGDKSSLRTLISSITNIQSKALLTADMSTYTIGERLLWADKRETKKPEDRIYCLIGLFSVALCIRYGEGLEHASLQLLRTLTQDYGYELKDLDIAESLRNKLSLGGIDPEQAGNSQESLTCTFRKISQRYGLKTSCKHDEIGSDSTKLVTKEMKERLLNGLAFPEMNSRINQINVNEPGTFKWIYDDYQTLSRAKPWHSFADWLSRGNGIYWVQGKAGSGKSTLMKFLWNNTRTKDLILKQSAYKSICVLKYSFWLSGSPLQRSHVGCYRSILHQALGNPDISIMSMFTAFPEIVSKQYMGDWSAADLETAILGLVEASNPGLAVCIFIDGLDELEGRDNYPPFVAFLMKLNSFTNVRLCVSSRPETFWCRRFAKEPQLQLQDLVEQDIRKYVTQRIEEASYQELEDDEKAKSGIIYSICEKAQGVFLWVHLATKAVLHALDGFASLDEVKHIVQTMPSEISGLYESMMQRQGISIPQVRREVALYFKLCMALSKSGASMMEYAIIRLELDRMKTSKHSWSYESLLSSAHNLRVRIPHISAGMMVCHDPLEVPDNVDDGKLLVTVEFFHRTVKDFLTDFPAGQALLQDCEISDDELLKAIFAGHLRYARQTHPTWTVQRLSKCMTTVSLMAQKVFNFSNEVMIEIIRNLDDEFALAPKPSGPFAPFAIHDSGQSPHRSLSQAPSEPCPADLSSSTVSLSVTGGRFHCVDIAGLALSANLTEYVDEMLRSCSSIAIPGSIAFTSSYKDYLLLCAISGGLGGARLHCALTLMDAGADPFANIYLPTWQPRRHCAAARIVSSFGFLTSLARMTGYRLLDNLEQVLIQRIIAMESQKCMVMCLSQNNSCETLSMTYDLDWNNNYRTSRRKGRRSLDRRRVLFETSIVAQLQHYVTCCKTRTYDWDPLSQGGISRAWLVDRLSSPPSVVTVYDLVHFPDVRYGPHFKALEMTKEELQDVIRVSRSRKAERKLHDPDLFDHIPSIKDLRPRKRSSGHAVDAKEEDRKWVDGNVFLSDIGFLIEKEDPRVVQSPFIRAIHVES